MKRAGAWTSVCAFDDLMPDTGVAALLEGRQIAVFRIGEVVYAIDNYDPHSEANVLSRGIVGDLNGEPVVASPIYKHHFNLATGRDNYRAFDGILQFANVTGPVIGDQGTQSLFGDSRDEAARALFVMLEKMNDERMNIFASFA